ncbi:hypothetical protein EON83_01120 [bacterium]|nr:MAG: hypothetical protein EON83_01120 [bacterium]
MNKQTWAENLKAYIRQQRASQPLPDRESLTPEEEMQCRLVGGELMGWCEQSLNGILQTRHALQIMEFDTEPLVVLTSTLPGIVAAEEIFGDANEHLFFLLETEFQAWQGYGADESYQWHIHHWSYFESPSAELLQRAEENFPNLPTQEFRVHTLGDLWGPNCGFESKHLWNWNGNDMDLLEQDFEESTF